MTATHSPYDHCHVEPFDWDLWSEHSYAVVRDARIRADRPLPRAVRAVQWSRFGGMLRNARRLTAHAWRVFRRVLRALKQLATDKRLPRWLRIMLIIGCVQIPVLPIDEIALVAALLIIGIWYRAPLTDALATVRGRG